MFPYVTALLHRYSVKILRLPLQEDIRKGWVPDKYTETDHTHP